MTVVIPGTDVELRDPTLTFTAHLEGVEKKVEWRLSRMDIQVLKTDPDKWVSNLNRIISRAMQKLVQQGDV